MTATSREIADYHALLNRLLDDRDRMITEAVWSGAVLTIVRRFFAGDLSWTDFKDEVEMYLDDIEEPT